MIDPKDWKWCGFTGHFIAGRWCRFHLATRVGDVLVSTVGDYRPCSGGHEQDTLGAGPEDFYEVVVFPVVHSDHCLAGEPDTSNSLLQERFTTSNEAEKRHMELCWLYAVGARVMEQ